MSPRQSPSSKSRKCSKEPRPIGSVKTVDAPFFDDKPLGGEYLILGTEQGGLASAPPYALSPRSRKYVSEIVKLPPLGTGPKVAPNVSRLTYFQNYFEDQEDLLKNDAFYEFTLAPYTDAASDQSRTCSTTSLPIGCKTRPWP